MNMIFVKSLITWSVWCITIIDFYSMFSYLTSTSAKMVILKDTYVTPDWTFSHKSTHQLKHQRNKSACLCGINWRDHCVRFAFVFSWDESNTFVSARFYFVVFQICINDDRCICINVSENICKRIKSPICWNGTGTVQCLPDM